GGRLDKCRNQAEVREVEKANGFLYRPDTFTTDLALLLAVDLDTAKAIGRNAKDYTVDVLVDRLQYGPPLDWGYYLRNAYIKADGDCDTLAALGTGVEGRDAAPRYFRVDTQK